MVAVGDVELSLGEVAADIGNSLFVGYNPHAMGDAVGIGHLDVEAFRPKGRQSASGCCAPGPCRGNRSG